MAPNTPNLVTKIKVQLKLSIARLRMVQQRDEALCKAARRSMAQLLEAGKIDSARIRVENIIRSDITTELHEMLELYCELLLARAGLLEGPQCDPGLEEAVKSIIYAAPKTEIKELAQARLLFAEKYGKDFVIAATDNTDGVVNDKVVKKLAVTPPREELVQGYLEEIAKTYGVNWPRREKADLGEAPTTPDLLGDDDDDDGGGGGGSEKLLETALLADPSSSSSKDAAAAATLDEREKRAQLSKATPPRDAVGDASPVHVYPPSPSTDNPRPRVTLNSLELKPNQKMADAAGAGSAADKKDAAAAGAKKTTTTTAKPSAKAAGPGGKVPDVDELARRFAALKR